MLDVFLKFSQNRPKKILFSSRLKKDQEKAKRTNLFISRKLFQKRPNGNPGRRSCLSAKRYFVPSLQLLVYITYILDVSYSSSLFTSYQILRPGLNPIIKIFVLKKYSLILNSMTLE
jgi:hypothetical protein